VDNKFIVWFDHSKHWISAHIPDVSEYGVALKTILKGHIREGKSDHMNQQQNQCCYKQSSSLNFPDNSINSKLWEKRELEHKKILWNKRNTSLSFNRNKHNLRAFNHIICSLFPFFSSLQAQTPNPSISTGCADILHCPSSFPLYNGALFAGLHFIFNILQY